MSNYKVSIIIPVYNTEEYLKDCLESVINQTLDNIEIICVNDGSSDNSLRILEEYALKDKRIKLISQKNCGLSKSRNVGIELAQGEYIYYLDSDDYIKLDCMQKLYEIAHKDNLDVLLFEGEVLYNSIYEDNKMYKNQFNFNYNRKNNYKGVFEGKELLIRLINNKDYFQPVWLQLAKREFIIENKLRFYEGILHEDVLYTLSVMMQARQAACIKYSAYVRRVRPFSIMTNTHTTFLEFYSSFINYSNELKTLFNTDDIELKGVIIRQLKQAYNHLKKIYHEIPHKNLSLADIQRIEELNDTEKMLLEHMGFEFPVYPAFPYEIVDKNSKIVLYGAGIIGQYYYSQLKISNYCEIVLWADKNYKKFKENKELEVYSPDKINSTTFDKVIIATKEEHTANAIKEELRALGIGIDKMVWGKPNYVSV